MTRRVILGLLILWILGGAVWALFLRSPGEPPPDDLGEIEMAPEEDREQTAPELATREPPALGKAGGANAGERLPEVPAWVLREQGLEVSRKRDRLLDWLQADPRRVLMLLHSRTRIPRGQSRQDYLTGWAFRGTRRYFAGAGAEFAFLAPILAAELTNTARNILFQSALLGALAGLGADAQTALAALLALARDDGRAGAVRAHALGAMIAVGGITPDVTAAFAMLFLGEHPIRGAGRTGVLKELQLRAEDAAPLVPALVELSTRPGGSWGDDSTILTILADAAPEDPAVVGVMAGALSHRDRGIRTLARRVVLQQGTDRLLEILRSVGGMARIEGIMLLEEQGVPTSDLLSLLLQALRGGPSTATDRAIKLLTTLRAEPRQVLPTVRELFASDEKGRWLTGVRILGALSRSTIDREPVMRQLFTAVRLPDVQVRKIAVQSLLMFDDQLDAIIPLLADLLDDTEAEVRVEAVDGLGELSAQDERARAHLQQALGDASEEVRALARYWLEEEDEE